MTPHPATPTTSSIRDPIKDSAGSEPVSSAPHNLEALCYRVVGRHMLLQSLHRMHASIVILRNERRMPHAAVNSLCQNVGPIG